MYAEWYLINGTAKEGCMERQIEARNLTMTPEWQERIDQEIDRIAEYHPGVIHHIRATLGGSTHQRLGLFEMIVVATVPKDIIVVKQKGEFVHPLIVESFEVLDRQLREYSNKRQKIVKTHEEQAAVGQIIELFPMEDYGRIAAPDEGLVYFHRNAVKNVSFDDLKEGEFVVFGEDSGDKGPQASWVRRK
jgi:ribosome-associated translation inhibitor RaiA/cold shock CspA family protein